MPYKDKEMKNKNARERYLKKKEDSDFIKRKRKIGRKADKKAYKANKGKKIAASLQWYKENKNKIKKRVKKASRRSYLKNKEEVLKRSSEYEHTERRKKNHKFWKLNNPEKIRVSRRKTYLTHKDYYRNRRLKKTYGISLNQFKDILINQHNRCGICHKKFIEIQPCIDHNHNTGLIRGILCRSCNSGIGLLKDNINILLKALDWVEDQIVFGRKSITLYIEKGKKYDNYLKRTYNITLIEFNEMLLIHNNQCGICDSLFINEKYRNPAIDHNHKTGKIRGLLCLKCNIAIGLLKENTNIINNAIKWLKKENKHA